MIIINTIMLIIISTVIMIFFYFFFIPLLVYSLFPTAAHQNNFGAQSADC